MKCGVIRISKYQDLIFNAKNIIKSNSKIVTTRKLFHKFIYKIVFMKIL